MRNILPSIVASLALVALHFGVPLLGDKPALAQASGYGVSGTGTYRIGGTQPVQGGAVFCGRKCHCGYGTTTTIETDAGKRIEGVIPPDGQRCSCAEVYRCDPASVGAPQFPASCPNSGGFSWTVPAGVVGN